MSRECAPAPGMLLTDSEEKCFSDLFSFASPDADATGRVAAGTKVAELFRASQLPADALRQIMNLCGAKTLGYFRRAQFHIALKLIAAAQAGLPIHLESINSELPLPQFFALKSDSETQHSLSQSTEAPGQLTRPVSLMNSARGTDSTTAKTETVMAAALLLNSPPPSPSYQKNQAVSRDGRQRVAFDQNNAVTLERSPTAGSVVYPEGQSHGNYEPKPSLPHSFYQKQNSVQPPDQEPEEDPSDYADDPWRITEEQREYYFNQFKSLQPDMKSLISGCVAKDLFTKSKLPIPELSHIWELSDVDCDGALTLYEFCAAFHLIVARKNGYSLPATLPETLLPEYLQRNEVPPALMHKDRCLCSHGNLAVEIQPVQQQWANWSHSEENVAAETVPATLPASILQQPELNFFKDSSDLCQNKNVDSKQIPEECQTTEDLFSLSKAGCRELESSQRRKTRPRSYSSTSAENAIKKGEVPPTPPPRLPKTHSRASSLDLNKLFQQGNQVVTSDWFQPPPAVPPRPPTAKIAPFPAKADINNLSTKPREKIQQPNFADFSKFSEQARKGPLTVTELVNKPSNLGEENTSSVKDTSHRQPPLKPLRRKLRPKDQGECQEQLTQRITASGPNAKPHHSQKTSSKQKKSIQTAIRKNKEANMILVRLNGELQQQFKDVHTERIVLESQLEHLRPVPHT